MNAVKFLIFTGAIFIISMFQSCAELRISMSGVKTEARVENVMVEVNKKTNEPTGRYVIHYEFIAKGTEQTQGVKGEYNTDLAEAESRAEGELKGKPIEVIYLPSNPMTHRVPGHRSTGWVVVFFVFLVVIGVNLYFVMQQAKADVQKSKRR